MCFIKLISSSRLPLKLNKMCFVIAVSEGREETRGKGGLGKGRDGGEALGMPANITVLQGRGKTHWKWEKGVWEREE